VSEFSIPWGLWDRCGWTPNYALRLSADEQYRLNIANGYSMEPALGTFYAGDKIVSQPTEEPRS
jgi:hypothetical protein